MYNKVILALGALSHALAAAGSVPDTSAPVTLHNDPNVVYRATIPKLASTTIRGTVLAHAPADGQGVTFNIKFTNLPEEGGPYLPADGNCTATGAHLDPYLRGESPPCDNTQPATCQAGDLSGKHGKPVSGTFEAVYTDLFVSTIAGSPTFFGNRSIVIHNKNKVRLTCANFSPFLSKNQTSSGSATAISSSATVAPSSLSSLKPTHVLTTSMGAASGTASSSVTAASSTVAVASNAASANGLSAAVILLGGVALLF